MRKQLAGSTVASSATTTSYIVDMMAELSSLAERSGDPIGAIIIGECADVLRRRNSLNAVLSAADRNAPDPILPL